MRSYVAELLLGVATIDAAVVFTELHELLVGHAIDVRLVRVLRIQLLS